MNHIIMKIVLIRLENWNKLENKNPSTNISCSPFVHFINILTTEQNWYITLSKTKSASASDATSQVHFNMKSGRQ